jgi:hypothetical protein
MLEPVMSATDMAISQATRARSPRQEFLRFRNARATPIPGSGGSARSSVHFPVVSATGMSLAASLSTRPSAAGTGNYSDTMERPVERTSMRGWLFGGAVFSVLLLAFAGGGLPLTELLAVGRDSALAGGVRDGFVSGLSALDLFQFALALFVGLTFRRFLA